VVEIQIGLREWERRKRKGRKGEKGEKEEEEKRGKGMVGGQVT
jgi:hypothetical protein